MPMILSEVRLGIQLSCHFFFEYKTNFQRCVTLLTLWIYHILKNLILETWPECLIVARDWLLEALMFIHREHLDILTHLNWIRIAWLPDWLFSAWYTRQVNRNFRNCPRKRHRRLLKELQRKRRLPVGEKKTIQEKRRELKEKLSQVYNFLNFKVSERWFVETITTYFLFFLLLLWKY